MCVFVCVFVCVCVCVCLCVCLCVCVYIYIYVQDPASLHYIQPGVNNQYQEAIEAVAPIGERHLDSSVPRARSLSFARALSLALPLPLSTSNGVDLA